MHNLSSLVARQKQVPGFYVPPRAVYSRQLAEVRALEGRLERFLTLNSRQVATAQEAVAGCLEAHAQAPSVPSHAAACQTSSEIWTEHVNEENGFSFYYNARTNESTYDPPAGVKRALARRS